MLRRGEEDLSVDVEEGMLFARCERGPLSSPNIWARRVERTGEVVRSPSLGLPVIHANNRDVGTTTCSWS